VTDDKASNASTGEAISEPADAPTGAPTPSGEQWRLTRGRAQVTVVEIGGGIREYAVGDRPVLDGYRRDAMATGGRGQTLAPWPNRLCDGAYSFGGSSHQTPLSEPKTHNAIHGLVRWRPFHLVERTEDTLTVEVVLLPQPGYPFALRLRNSYFLGDDGLTVTTTALNFGDTPLPYGLGFHPYLTVGSPTVDADTVQVPATTRLLADERGLPTGRTAVEGTEYDLRQPRSIGTQQLDTAYTDLERDGDGAAAVTLAGQDGARSVRLWVDESFPYLMVFTGDTLPAAERRQGLAVEPMTCAPDAFNSGDGLLTVSPGEQVTTHWGITPTGW
jgi:aldose 1-epimerase